ncbi:ABC transporter permease [Anaerolentibacter hominis]|uniref:ABC transporter permease n=1 Tax=Anaerolentibacter hominis TaxID=3079009 RepID=UPI0031B8A34A
MNNAFYSKLAFTNLKKNGATYLPYILSSCFTIMAYFIVDCIAHTVELTELRGGQYVTSFMGLGSVVVGIFAFIFLYYTNSFLIRKRKKELGLYSILGLGKKHVAKLMFFETIITSAISLAGGLLGGVIFGKLLYWVLLRVSNIRTTVPFSPSLGSFSRTAVLFGIIFIITFLFNLVRVHLANPIDLLQGGKKGEKEPRASWLLAILGFAALGGGYYISFTTKNPLESIFLFFVAVILVILGTYCLFTTGCIAVLKLLKKKKGFYYQSRNFVSLSGMIYRMKQNAAGLATICILCTMVLVTIGSTVALYAGADKLLDSEFTRDVRFYMDAKVTPDPEKLNEIVGRSAKELGLSQERPTYYYYYNSSARLEENTLSPLPNDMTLPAFDVFLLTLDDYQRMTGSEETLGKDELFFFSFGKDYHLDTLHVGVKDYQIKQTDQVLDIVRRSTDNLIESSLYLVLPDETSAFQIWNVLNRNEFPNFMKANFCYEFDIQGAENEDEVYELIHQIGSKLEAETDMEMFMASSIYFVRSDWYSSNGSFLFLGVFLGSLFLMATVLIIYFKQISEGYDDHDRFVILQKVGMDKKEVKKTIHKQIMMVFFLPLAVAVLHLAAAQPIIYQILRLFALSNLHTILICMGTTALVFAVVYLIVYMMTSRTYYKIVNE